jgi:predicted nucleic acid-binding protein
MGVVIADAGPLIALSKIKHLHILKDLFSEILLTQAVADECLRVKSDDAVLIEQAITLGWLKCVDNPDFRHVLSSSLGLGELSSIEYALQNKENTLLILDDALARKQAIRKELTIIGTAAIVFTAQRKGLISDAEAIISQLNQVGYRISSAVVSQIKTSLA